jgi:hypothetical protein
VPDQNRALGATQSASYTSPNTGEQWALLTWPSAQTLTAAEVYFFDDNGGVRSVIVGSSRGTAVPTST